MRSTVGKVSKACGDRPWMFDTWGMMGLEKVTQAQRGEKRHQYPFLSESLRLFNEIFLPYLSLPRSG